MPDPLQFSQLIDSSAASGLVTFIVCKDGIEGKFLVHKGENFLSCPSLNSILVGVEHVCRYSSVLKAAFRSCFLEGQTQTYRLEDTDPKTFQLLVQWFHTQNFKHIPASVSVAVASVSKYESTEKSTQDIVENTAAALVQIVKERLEKRRKQQPEIDTMYLAMAQLYVLAERFVIPRFQNYIMTSLVEMANRSYSTAWMTVAYEGTTAESPLRRFAVDMVLYQVASEWKKLHADGFPRELLVDVAVGATLTGGQNGINYFHTRVKKGYMVHEFPV